MNKVLLNKEEMINRIMGYKETLVSDSYGYGFLFKRNENVFQVYPIHTAYGSKVHYYDKHIDINKYSIVTVSELESIL
jgi:hypothetical protein